MLQKKRMNEGGDSLIFLTKLQTVILRRTTDLKDVLRILSELRAEYPVFWRVVMKDAPNQASAMRVDDNLANLISRTSGLLNKEEQLRQRVAALVNAGIVMN